MGLLSYIFGRKAAEPSIQREESQQTATQSTAVSSGVSVMTGAGIWDAIASNPLKVATVYRCTELLSGIVASLPLRYLRREGDIMADYATSPLTYILRHQPMAGMNAHVYWQTVMRRLLTHGNAYLWPRWINGELTELVLVTGAVAHDKYHHTYIVQDVVGGVSGTFREDEVIHLKGYTLDGQDGVSVLTYAANSIGIATTADSETLKRFQTGGVRGIVSNERGVTGFGEYSDSELSKSADDLTRALQSGGIAAVPGKVEFTALGLNSADLQFLEQKKFTVRELCRFFGVHPSLVFDDTSNNYKSAETASVDFLTFTLGPILDGIEAELNCKLVGRTMAGKRQFSFDRSALQAMDSAGKAAYMTSTIANGIYTVNDWRRKENRPPVDGGDIPMRSANLVPLTDGAEVPAAQEQTKQIDTETNTDGEE